MLMSITSTIINIYGKLSLIATNEPFLKYIKIKRILRKPKDKKKKKILRFLESIL